MDNEPSNIKSNNRASILVLNPTELTAFHRIDNEAASLIYHYINNTLNFTPNLFKNNVQKSVSFSPPGYRQKDVQSKNDIISDRVFYALLCLCNFALDFSLFDFLFFENYLLRKV